MIRRVHRLRVIEGRLLRKILVFGTKLNKATGELRNWTT
jgi:hypothetical protein